MLARFSADARYREGVFHLDSLRMNAERVSQSGANVGSLPVSFDALRWLILSVQFLHTPSQPPSSFRSSFVPSLSVYPRDIVPVD